MPVRWQLKCVIKISYSQKEQRRQEMPSLFFFVITMRKIAATLA